jgi:hypothetical protein
MVVGYSITSLEREQMTVSTKAAGTFNGLPEAGGLMSCRQAVA